MTQRIPRHLLTGALAVAVFYGLLGTEVQCTTAEARPSLADLQAQIDDLRSQQLHVFDASGLDVGIFMEGNGAFLRVFHESSGTSFGVSPEGDLLQPTFITLFFEGFTCDTAPLTAADPDGGGFLFRSGLGFVAIENATPPTLTTIRSRRSEGGCFSQNSDILTTRARAESQAQSPADLDETGRGVAVELLAGVSHDE